MKQNRPLQIMELLVLSVLLEGPLHGYGLVQALEDRTGGRLRIRPGNLYRILDRLLAAGLLEAAEPPEGPSLGAERSRGFAITEPGATRVEGETELFSKALGRAPVLHAALLRGLRSVS